MKPEGDGLGGVLEQLGRHVDATVLDRQLVRVGHGPHHVDAGQGIGQTGGLADIVQRGVAATELFIDPECLPGGRVEVAFSHAELRPPRTVAAVDRELFSRGRQGLLDHLFGDPDVLAGSVHAGPRLGKSSQHLGVRQVDAHLLQDPQRGLVQRRVSDSVSRLILMMLDLSAIPTRHVPAARWL